MSSVFAYSCFTVFGFARTSFLLVVFLPFSTFRSFAVIFVDFDCSQGGGRVASAPFFYRFHYVFVTFSTLRPPPPQPPPARCQFGQSYFEKATTKRLRQSPRPPPGMPILVKATSTKRLLNHYANFGQSYLGNLGIPFGRGRKLLILIWSPCRTTLATIVFSPFSFSFFYRFRSRLSPFFYRFRFRFFFVFGRQGGALKTMKKRP